MGKAREVLRVWCLSDGRPGHYNQSHGIVKALSHRYDTRQEWIEADLRLPFMRPLLPLLLNHTRGAWFRLIMACYRCRLPAGAPDMIVSAGGNTLFLNAALARHFHCKNLFSGSLRRLSHRCFTGYLTLAAPAHDNAIQVLLAPTEMDSDELTMYRNHVREEQGWSGPIWCMVIGGDSGFYTFTAHDWIELARFMARMSDLFHVRWLLTTSPRTGQAVDSLLRDNIDPALLLDAVWYSQAPRKVMRDYLAAADVVMCTEDSLTMLTEAVSAGRPVISLRPARVSPNAAYEHALSRLTHARLLASLPITELDEVNVGEVIDTLEPIAESMPAILARKLEALI
ncbi:MAG: hypothetical protein HKP57_06625 [Halobacteria archaeon]|nr:hypothetical protein [Halobacteria archaeon]